MRINIEKIKMVNLGRYDITLGNMEIIWEEAKKSSGSESGIMHDWDLLVLAYKYGFMRGQNAEKARKKRTETR